MPRYLVSYDYRGFQWCEEITADSLRDADARLRHMGDGRVDGEVKLSLMFPRRGFRIYIPLAIIGAAVVVGVIAMLIGWKP